jgi:hypothetical protein
MIGVVTNPYDCHLKDGLILFALRQLLEFLGMVRGLLTTASIVGLQPRFLDMVSRLLTTASSAE